LKSFSVDSWRLPFGRPRLSILDLDFMLIFLPDLFMPKLSDFVNHRVHREKNKLKKHCKDALCSQTLN